MLDLKSKKKKALLFTELFRSIVTREYCSFCKRKRRVSNVEKSFAPHARFPTTLYILQCGHHICRSVEQDS